MLLQALIWIVFITVTAEIAEYYEDEDFCLAEINTDNASLANFPGELGVELDLEWSHLLGLTGLFCGCYCRGGTRLQYLFEVLTTRLHCEGRDRCFFIDEDNYVDMDGFGCSPTFHLITIITGKAEYHMTERKMPARMGWNFTEFTEPFNRSTAKADIPNTVPNVPVDDHSVMPDASTESHTRFFDMSLLGSLLQYPMEAVSSFLQIILDGGD